MYSDLNLVNQAELDAVIKEVTSIKPDLQDNIYVTHKDNMAIAVNVELPQRGNKEIINKLLAVGFKVARRKKATGFDSVYGNQYDGYSMLVVLRKKFYEKTPSPQGDITPTLTHPELPSLKVHVIEQPQEMLDALSKCYALQEELSGLKNTHDQLQESFDQLYESNQKMAAELEKYRAAEREKRLVILPCPLGSEVFTIHEDYFDCTHCQFGGEASFDETINQVCCDLPNGRMCPLSIRSHTVKGFTVGIGTDGTPEVSQPGEFGFEGLETFYGIDGAWHTTKTDALMKAANYKASERIQEE